MPAGHSKHSNSKAECLAEADKEDEGNETKLAAVEEAWDATMCAALGNSRAFEVAYDLCVANMYHCMVGTTAPVGVSSEYYCGQCMEHCDHKTLCDHGLLA